MSEGKYTKLAALASILTVFVAVGTWLFPFAPNGDSRQEDDELKALRSELEEIVERRGLYKKEQLSLEKELFGEEVTLEEREQELDDLQNKYDNAIALINKLHQAFQEYNSKRENYRRQGLFAAAEDQLELRTETSTQVKRVTREAEHISEKINELKPAAQRLKQSIDQKKKRVTLLNGRIVGLNQKAKELSRRISDYSEM